LEFGVWSEEFGVWSYKSYNSASILLACSSEQDARTTSILWITSHWYVYEIFL